MPPRKLNLAQPSINWSCYSGSVQSQGLCGSCYAFASANLADTMIAIYQKGLHISFSVQELISCSPSPTGNGCLGGIFDTPLSYIKEKGGLSNLKYPYTSHFTISPEPCDL